MSFTNALRSGKITVEKVDIQGSRLAGATFLLEWSEDGSLWWPIEYSETFGGGKCSNPDIVDGYLTTGADGILEWDSLHPGLHYRLTETEAPDGFQLLKEPAFAGELPEGDLTVSVRVTNVRTFTMPETGASTGMLLRLASLAAALGCVCLIVTKYRKKKG